jgi:uncharacterized protein YjcR
MMKKQIKKEKIMLKKEVITYNDIAEHFGVSYNTISRWKNDSKYRFYFEKNKLPVSNKTRRCFYSKELLSDLAKYIIKY